MIGNSPASLSSSHFCCFQFSIVNLYLDPPLRMPLRCEVYLFALVFHSFLLLLEAERRCRFEFSVNKLGEVAVAAAFRPAVGPADRSCEISICHIPIDQMGGRI